MKPPEKGKRPRVPANIIKKTDRSSNSSTNRSFLNKSTNHYITDLRNNNARLAHSLASERTKTAQLFRRYTESQALLMGQKALLRSTSQAIKMGVNKINDSIDLMIQGTSILYDVNQKIVSYYPELEELVPTQSPALTPNQMRTPSGGDNCTATSPSARSLSSPERGSLPITTASSVRHCTAKPMVKGQIISHPTISLQRVNVPTRSLGKGMIKPIKPARGVQMFPQSDNMIHRLSNVPEEMNESMANSSRSSLSSTLHSQNSPPDSEPCTSNSLPASHVLLERIGSDYMCPTSENSPKLHSDVEQLTVVHFGSMNFNNPPSSPKKPVSPREKGNTDSPNPLHSSNSDQYLTESSSEDEDLALQIVESKKSFIERTRQLDSKEGTSWNYDEAGKFRERPPKRKRAAKSSQSSAPQGKPRALKRHAEERLSHPREVRLKQRTEQGSLTKSPLQGGTCCSTSPKTSNKCNHDNSPTLPASSGASPANVTIHEDEDMSFTCVSMPHLLPSQPTESKTTSNEEDEEICKGGKESLQTSEHPSFSERTIFITQRSRGRRQESSTSQDMCFSLSYSEVENNENYPPKHTLSDDVAMEKQDKKPMSTMQDLHPLPNVNVVLERLPSNIISGSSLQLIDGVFEGCRISKSRRSPVKDIGAINIEAQTSDPKSLTSSEAMLSSILPSIKLGKLNPATIKDKVCVRSVSGDVPSQIESNTDLVQKSKSKERSKNLKQSTSSEQESNIALASSKPIPILNSQVETTREGGVESAHKSEESHQKNGRNKPETEQVFKKVEKKRSWKAQKISEISQQKSSIALASSKPNPMLNSQVETIRGGGVDSAHQSEGSHTKNGKLDTDQISKTHEKKRSWKAKKTAGDPGHSDTSQSASASLCSSPTSPVSSINAIPPLSESENHQRLRRNVAPPSYKEPPCNKKLRRP